MGRVGLQRAKRLELSLETLDLALRLLDRGAGRTRGVCLALSILRLAPLVIAAPTSPDVGVAPTPVDGRRVERAR
jgi:hypothetical protein